MAIRIGIYGYGNLGKGVEASIRQNPDMELVSTVSQPRVFQRLQIVPVHREAFVLLALHKNAHCRVEQRVIKDRGSDPDPGCGGRDHIGSVFVRPDLGISAID